MNHCSLGRNIRHLPTRKEDWRGSVRVCLSKTWQKFMSRAAYFQKSNTVDVLLQIGPFLFLYYTLKQLG